MFWWRHGSLVEKERNFNAIEDLEQERAAGMEPHPHRPGFARRNWVPSCAEFLYLSKRAPGRSSHQTNYKIKSPPFRCFAGSAHSTGRNCLGGQSANTTRWSMLSLLYRAVCPGVFQMTGIQCESGYSSRCVSLVLVWNARLRLCVSYPSSPLYLPDKYRSGMTYRTPYRDIQSVVRLRISFSSFALLVFSLPFFLRTGTIGGDQP